MEAIFVYFLKANGLLILFFLAYYFLLSKETFFTKNRWFLLMGLFASVLLPLITFTKVIWVDPTPITFEAATNDYIPYIIENKVIEEPIDWNSILVYVYVTIACLLVLKISIEILSFFRIIRLGKKNRAAKTILIDNLQNENPFSFFNYIVFNSQRFNEEELQHIITHENIHVNERHSFDVLIAKIFCALFWINPIMWLYQKEMLQNLEYIADDKASAIAQNKINYQRTLLKVVTHQHQLSITNQFYQSLIKKRIVMLNTHPSHQKNSWKYALILPVLSAFMLLFQVETVAQVKEVTEETNYAVSSNYSSILTKNTTDEELKELEETFSNENQKLSISNVKRNKNGEIIEIKLTFDSGKTYNQILERKSSEPINDIKIYANSDDNDTISCGFVEVDNKATNAIEAIKEEIVDGDGLKVEISKEYWSFDNMTKNGKEVILIINGKVKGATEKVKIPLNEEMGKMKKLTPAEFEKKYKKKADKNKYYYEVETVKVKTVNGSWKDNEKSEKNRLYIINGKEYMQNEIPKGNTISLEGTITELSKEEGIKKYGQKGKDGVLIFEGRSTFVTDEEQIKQVKLEIERAEKEIERAKLEIENSKPEIERAKLEIKRAKEDIEKAKPEIAKAKMEIEMAKAEMEKSRMKTELDAQRNSKFSKEELEERRMKREQLLEERKKILEERKSKLEESKKENLLNKINYVQFILSNGDGIVIMEKNRIKIPEYPTAMLNKVSLYFNDEKISDSEFVKLNYDLIKSLKVINIEGTKETFKPIKEIYFYSK